MDMSIDQWLQYADEGLLSRHGIPAMPQSLDGHCLAHYTLYYGSRLLGGPNPFWEEVSNGAVLTLWGQVPERERPWR